MRKDQKLQTWQIITLGLLTLCIIVLAILLVLKKNHRIATKTGLTVTEFEQNFKTNGQEIEQLAHFEKKQTKKTDTKHVFTLDDDFYLGVLFTDQKQVTKSYYYVKKDLYSSSTMMSFLIPLIKSMDMKLTKTEVTEIAKRLTDIEHKKADELGFFVQFQKNNYEYMVLEKEQGAYLQFFITKIN